MVKIPLSPEDLGIWSLLGLSPPMLSSDCAELKTKLLEKRAWLATNPPKKKKARV